MINKQKGFTLIELLVVVAIIGILASVVLASLNSARAKGKDAAVKSALASYLAQAEIIVDGGTYANAAVCGSGAAGTDQTLINIKNNIEKNSTVGNFHCSVSANGIAVSATLNAGGGYCIDNNAKVGTTILTTFTTGMCP